MTCIAVPVLVRGHLNLENGEANMTSLNHPVHFRVEMPTGPRNRLTAFFRPILAIPHLLLVGGPALGLLGGGYRTGALGALAILIALIDWFAILFTGSPIRSLEPLKRLYLGWRAHVLAYASFLRDEYPPFGEGPYPAELELPATPETRDRADMLLRPLMLIPHLIVLALLLLLWMVVAVVSWLWLSIAGDLPASLWRFNRDVLAYSLRIETYALLIQDVFTPFSLTEAPTAPTAGESAAAPV
jgi:hypothetical protein